MSSSQPVAVSPIPCGFKASVTLRALHQVHFGKDFLDPSNPLLASIVEPRMDGPARILVVVDGGVMRGWPDLPDRIERYRQAHFDRLGLTRILTVSGGETTKNDSKSLDAILAAIEEDGICRQSYVLVFGGGAVLDVAGYAASMAHRGVRLIRFPTTTLSQGDSGVGVKNGINRFGKKNFLGSFDVPIAVFNDEIYLTSLSDRDWRAGFSEAVKVSLIKDATFFVEIEGIAEEVESRHHDTLMPVLRRSAELHFKHIVEQGDPFERTVARPLDFGHWAAHKIEQMTDFSVPHGEGVAMGVALDTVYSAVTGHLPWEEADRVCRCLCRMGFQLHHESMEDTDTLFRGIEEFRQHLGGQLAVTLLKGIGQGFTCHEIDEERLKEALAHLSSIPNTIRPT